MNNDKDLFMLEESFVEFKSQLKHLDEARGPPVERHELYRRVNVLVAELDGHMMNRRTWQTLVDAATEHYKLIIVAQGSGPHGRYTHSYTEYTLELYNNAKRDLIRVTSERDMAGVAMMQAAAELATLQREYGRAAISVANAVERAKYPDRFIGKPVLIGEPADQISAALRDW